MESLEHVILTLIVPRICHSGKIAADCHKRDTTFLAKKPLKSLEICRYINRIVTESHYDCGEMWKQAEARSLPRRLASFPLCRFSERKEI